MTAPAHFIFFSPMLLFWHDLSVLANLSLFMFSQSITSSDTPFHLFLFFLKSTCILLSVFQPCLLFQYILLSCNSFIHHAALQTFPFCLRTQVAEQQTLKVFLTDWIQFPDESIHEPCHLIDGYLHQN